MARSADHRHQEIFDAGLDIEGRRIHGPLHMRVEKARDRGEHGRIDEDEDADAENIDAEGFRRDGASLERANRPADAGIEQVPRRDHSERDDNEDEVIKPRRCREARRRKSVSGGMPEIPS